MGELWVVLPMGCMNGSTVQNEAVEGGLYHPPINGSANRNSSAKMGSFTEAV